jgi:PKD repeat protein
MVTVADDDGQNGVANESVVVKNDLPMLTVSAPNINRNEGQLLDLTGSSGGPTVAQFTDIGSLDLHKAQINWGDGFIDVGVVSEAGGNGSIGGSHTYADDGTYLVTIRVANDDMAAFLDASKFNAGTVGVDFVEITFTVTVSNKNPVVLAPNGDQNILEGGTVNFSNLATFTDDGFDNPLNTNPFLPPAIGDPLAESFTYDIDWGDGRDAVLNASIADLNGSPGVPSSGTISGSHTYADNGDYTVTITVHDDNGGIGVVQFVVHVTNVEPELTGITGLAVDEGELFTLNGLGVGLIDPGFDNPLNTNMPPNGGQVAETLSSMTINWGDGTGDQPIALAEFQAVPFMGPTTATFPGASHTYADNGTYTVSITFKDDDMAAFKTQTFQIIVHNVAPTLSNFTSTPTTINEAGSVSFNIDFSDPGFNNPLNTLDPANGGEVAEFFTFDINWGDGRHEVISMPVASISGSPGVLTTGSFGGSHIYADDGTYTVTIRVHDDDDGDDPAPNLNGPVLGDGINDFDEHVFTVVVNNVAPTIQPDGAIPPFAGIDVTTDGFTQIQLSYSDPGFDNTANLNPLELPNVTDRLHESFTHIIDWGDGSVDAVHTYATPGVYTVFVTVPGSATPLEFTLTVTDISQPPVLTLVGSQASLNDPGVLAQPFQYTINWGDDPAGNNDTIQTVTLMLKNPVGTPFVGTQTTVLQSIRTPGNEGILTTGSFLIQHQYAGPPNPLNPTADIPISVTVVDDNMGSDSASIAIGNPGIQVINIRIDTTPDVPRLEYVRPQGTQVFLDRTTTTPQTLQQINVRIARGELSATTDSYLELQVISPDGIVVESYRLRDEVLTDLRGFISRLPDGHYKIVLVRAESRRLVLDVYVRGGHVVDPSDDSEGTRDKPPTEDAKKHEAPAQKDPFLDEAGQNPPGAMNVPVVPVDQASLENEQPATLEPMPAIAAEAPSASRLRWAAPLAGLGLVAARGSWSREVDAAFDRADERKWQRLRRAARTGLLKK